jgi:HAD superfamily hydrolase (TIGR01549 family)
VDLQAHTAPGGRVEHATNGWIGGGRLGGRPWFDEIGHGPESSIGSVRVSIGRLRHASTGGRRNPGSDRDLGSPPAAGPIGGRAGRDRLRFAVVRAVLFDWDGTLVDTLPFMYAATELVMAEFGVAITWDDYRRHFTPDWRLLYRRFRLPEEMIEPVGARWWTLYRGRDEAILLPGAADALRRLADAGVALGVVTAGRRDSVEPQLERHGLSGLLVARVYGDDPFEPKPGPAGLRHALALLGAADRAAETAYVGDALDDMRMAVAAGARGIGIRTDLATAAELRDAGAAEVASSVAAWVDGLGR